MYALSSAGIFLIITLVLILTICIIVIVLIEKARRFIRGSLGSSVSSLINQMQRSEIEMNTTPRSLSGGDIIFEPIIVKNFPHFHKETVFAKAERCLIDCLDAIEGKDTIKLTKRGYGDGIIAYVSAKIGNSPNIVFENTKIHKKCISNYRKTKQYCSVVIQIAYEYKVSLNRKDKGLQQMKAELEYTYLFQNDSNSNVISTVCPNCGAPVETSNQSKCPYCDVGIIGVIEKTWVFTNIRET